MITGIVLISMGVLLVIFPQLLAFFVASLLIFTGILVISVARYNRQFERSFENPTVDFFFRY